MNVPTQKHWYFHSANRDGISHAGSLKAPGAYNDLTVSLVDPFISGVPSAESIERVIYSLPDTCLQSDVVILRGPLSPDSIREITDSPNLVREIARRVGHEPSLLLLQLEEGAIPRAPTLTTLIGKYLWDDAFLRAVRALEFASHVSRTHAVYQAHDAHFQLPSGIHASKYVRIADLFDDIAVVRRLADWLEHLLTSETVLIGDSWTMLPFLLELGGRVSPADSIRTGARGDRLPVLTFAEYPNVERVRRVLDIAVELTSGALRPSIVFVSGVLGSGQTLDRMIGLATQFSPIPIVPYALISAEENDPRPDVCLSLGGQIKRYEVQRGEACLLCNNAQSAPVILIDPKTYSPIVEVQRHSYMVTAPVAALYRPFWEMADHRSAIRVHTTEATKGTQRHLHIDIRVDMLLQDENFSYDVMRRLKAFRESLDLVLVPENLSTVALTRLVGDGYPSSNIISIPRAILAPPGDDSTIDSAIRETLERADGRQMNILLLDEVLLTGGTIRSLHRLLQNSIGRLFRSGLEKCTYNVSAFVIIARPEYSEQWGHLCDSLRQTRAVDLQCHMSIPMPTQPCPWCQEMRTLSGILSFVPTLLTMGASDEARLRAATETLKVRLDILTRAKNATNEGMAESLFLCGRNGAVGRRDPEHISPNSLFGEGLSEVTCYAAMATAIHSLRQEANETHSGVAGSHWMWDVARIINAYHDPLLQASFLRAISAHELRLIDRERTLQAIRQVLFTSPDPAQRQSAVVAAEHAFAGVAGKYPADMRSRVNESAVNLLGEWSSEALSMINVLTQADQLGLTNRLE